MRKIIFAVCLMMMGNVMNAANAAEVGIESAQLDGMKQNILVEVSYGTNGEGPHVFSLKPGACRTVNLQIECQATIIHQSDVANEMFATQTLSFSMRKYGYDQLGLSGAKLTIFGTWDKHRNGPSSAIVYLPTYR